MHRISFNALVAGAYATSLACGSPTASGTDSGSNTANGGHDTDTGTGPNTTGGALPTTGAPGTTSGSDPTDGGGPGTTDTATSTTTTGPETGTTAAGTDTTAPDTSSTGDTDSGGACVLLVEDAEVTPLSLYVALDRSSSMAGSKWDAAKAGLAAFANDPASVDVEVALNFFPLKNNPTCDVALYKPPVVACGPLPANADALVQALNGASPDGLNTPIYPAVGGAIAAAKEQGDASPPGAASAVILVTDGQPQGPAMCDGVDPEDPQAIAVLVSGGLSLGVETFVIGLPGVNASVADPIAAAGGTGAAIVVSNIDLPGQFHDALALVRDTARPCHLALPGEVMDGRVDHDLVNLLVDGESLPQDPACTGAGWKYDDSMDPTYIVVCPASCPILGADPAPKLEILLGCPTDVIG